MNAFQIILVHWKWMSQWPIDRYYSPTVQCFHSTFSSRNKVNAHFSLVFFPGCFDFLVLIQFMNEIETNLPEKKMEKRDWSLTWDNYTQVRSRYEWHAPQWRINQMESKRTMRWTSFFLQPKSSSVGGIKHFD